MKISKTLFMALSTAALSCALCALSGCETESAASASISVSPSSATLTAANASVVLSASGGWSYAWELGDGAIGTLNKTTGSSVVYTATSFGSNAVQTVTVSASGLTNSVGGSATVSITQK